MGLMFKSRRGRLYSNQLLRPKHRRPTFWQLALAIPAAAILLELGARLLVNASASEQPSSVREAIAAYRFQFLNGDRQPIPGLPDNNGSLALERQMAVGYGLVGEQYSRFWRINEAGLRDREPLPLDKPEGEVRIFIIGDSAAFGVGTPSNEATIAHQLELILQERLTRQSQFRELYQPSVLPAFEGDRLQALQRYPRLRGQQYRVINAAVPGYASGNQLAQIALEILPYQPDAIVVIGGYRDLMLPSSQESVDIPQIDLFLGDAHQHFRVSMMQPLKQWWQQLYLVRAKEKWFSTPKSTLTAQTLSVTEDVDLPLSQHLPEDTPEGDRRIERYRQNQIQMVRLAAGAKVPLISVIQPEITGRPTDKLTPQEQDIIAELGSDYFQQFKLIYARLVAANEQIGKAFPRNVKTFNFYTIYQDLETTAFQDPVNLTEDGNRKMAERLYHAVSSLPQLQVKPVEPTAQTN